MSLAPNLQLFFLLVRLMFLIYTGRILISFIVVDLTESVCLCARVAADCSESWSSRSAGSLLPTPLPPAAAAGRLPGLLERLWRMTAAQLAAESRWMNGVSCPNDGSMAHGKVTITVDEYSSNPTQAFTHYNINQSRFQPPHVHM